MSALSVDDPYAVVFSGGGAFGSWEVGCYRAILRRHDGRKPTVVTGASAGALNAAGVHVGFTADDLQAIWTRLTADDVYTVKPYRLQLLLTMFRLLWSGSVGFSRRGSRGDTSLYDTTPLQRTLHELLRDRDVAFFKSEVKLAISLTDLVTGERQLFYRLPRGATLPPEATVENSRRRWVLIDSISVLVQCLMGSTAIPFIFPPFEGKYDGGIMLNQPVTPAITLGAKTIYVVIPTETALGRTDSFVALSNSLLSTWLSSSLVHQIEIIRLRNELRRAVGDPLIRLCTIRPLQSLRQRLGIGFLSFGNRVGELIAQGESDANLRLDHFDPMIESTWY